MSQVMKHRTALAKTTEMMALVERAALEELRIKICWLLWP